MRSYVTKAGIPVLALASLVLVLACGGTSRYGDDSGTDATADGTDTTGDAPGDGPADGVWDTTDDAPPDVTGDDVVASGCGNGILEGAEQCDDGNTDPGDGCDGSCMVELPPHCGDGDVDYAEGEQCDDGGTDAGDGCSPTCQTERPPGCGDGILDIDEGEQCDDGGTDAGDGCSPTCQFEAVGRSCGNGSMELGEVCDDSNVVNGDGCNPTCNLANATELFVGSQGVQGLVDGTGSAGRIGGYGTLTVDRDHLYYADGSNNCIRRIEISTAAMQTIAGDAVAGTAGYVDDPTGTVARFSGIEAVATDGHTLWVSSGRRIRAVDLAPPFAVTTVAGAGTQGHTDGFGLSAEFDDLRGLTYHAGKVYLLDGTAATLRSFDPVTTEVVTLAGTPYTTGTTDGFGTAGLFTSPRYMASDNSGMLYIADTNGNTIRSYNTVTTWLGTFAGNGTAGYVDAVGTAALIHRPRGMTSDGTSIYWVEFNQHTIRQGVLATREVSTLVGTHCDGAMPCAGGYNEGVGTAALLDGPFSVAFHHPTNSLFFVDGGNFVIRRIR